MFRLLSVSLLSMALLGGFACAKNQSAAPASAGNSMMQSGAAALASKLNINQSYVELAASTAQSLMAKGSDEPSAINQGVDEAAAKASADGKPLSTDQRSGLLDGLKNLISA